MPALRYDLAMQKGAYFKRTFKWLDKLGELKQIEGWRGHMQIKTGYGGDTVASLSTENGGINIITGYITIVVEEQVTSQFVVPVIDPKQVPKRIFYYDLFLYDLDDNPFKYLYGNNTVYGSITDEN